MSEQKNTVDRTKIMSIENERGQWRVYSMNKKLLGGFTNEAAAIAFRDSVPLDKVFAS